MRGAWAIYSMPWGFTCPSTVAGQQACRFRDEYEKFVQAGAAVFGISGDSPAENAAFAKAQNLQYPLLTDAGNILRKVRACACVTAIGQCLG